MSFAYDKICFFVKKKKKKWRKINYGFQCEKLGSKPTISPDFFLPPIMEIIDHAFLIPKVAINVNGWSHI